MYYDDPDMMYDEYRIAKYEEKQLQEEEKQEMLTVNYKTSDNDDNVNNNTNEVNEMSENKKVAVVFVSAKGKMSKPMMAVEDVAAVCDKMDWRNAYAREDHIKKEAKTKRIRMPKNHTITNPRHVNELGLPSGKLQQLATYRKIFKMRGYHSGYPNAAKALFDNAEIKYYSLVDKRPITYNEAMAMAKNKVQDAKTIIEVKLDKPVADKPVSLFSQEVTTPLEIKVDLNKDKRHQGFKESDGYTFDEMLEKLEQERQEGIKRLIDDLRAFDWDDGLLETQQDNKEKALEAIREAKQQIEAAEKLLEQN